MDAVRGDNALQELDVSGLIEIEANEAAVAALRAAKLARPPTAPRLQLRLPRWWGREGDDDDE